jgi:hypothetical protein
MKTACLIFNMSFDSLQNFSKDNFFITNAVNSFKTFHPDIELICITNENFNQYLSELSITEYFDNLGILRIHLIKELMRQKGYEKFIMLGADTITCDRLTEFLESTSDMICSSGPPYLFLKTPHWSPKLIEFYHNGKLHADVDFINADVVCFNNLNVVELLYNKSLEFWSEHAEQGGMNYLYQNQSNLNIKVDIVDFPYIKANVLYNVRSKGIAFGGNQMYRGNVYSGNYKDKTSKIIGHVYPTSTFYVKENKLYTDTNKQIKVFHYAEALGIKPYEEYVETMNEIKTKWFNSDTIEFLIKQCNCIF